MVEKLCPILMLKKDIDRRSEMTCYGQDCAWFIDGKCAVANISEEIFKQGKSISGPMWKFLKGM